MAKTHKKDSNGAALTETVTAASDAKFPGNGQRIVDDKISSVGFVTAQGATRISFDFFDINGSSFRFDATLVPALPKFTMRDAKMTYDVSRSENILVSKASFNGYIGPNDIDLKLFRTEEQADTVVQVAEVKATLEKPLFCKNSVCGSGVWADGHRRLE